MTSDATSLLRQLLEERILLLDGSMGALLFSRELKEADYKESYFARHDKNLTNCHEALNFSQPALIEEIHRAG